MGKQATRLLADFETLPNADKQTSVVETLRRTRELPFDSGPLTDEEIGESSALAHADIEGEPWQRR
jgi:hypothetical protein